MFVDFSEAVCLQVFRAFYQLAGGRKEHAVASSQVAAYLGIPVGSAIQVLQVLARQQLVVCIRASGGDAHFWLTPEGMQRAEGRFPSGIQVPVPASHY